MAEGKEQQAIALEKAKETLDRQIEEALETYQQQSDEPLEFNLPIEENPEVGGAPTGDAELRQRVLQLVEDFHRQDVVRQSGVHVQKVTVLDSDADGQVAIDVEYAYAE